MPKQQIIYQGKVYQLSKNYGGGKYYYNRSKGALHRVIWEFSNKKKIPKLHEIHHIDGNCYNNAPKNLELVKKGFHQKAHWSEKQKKSVICLNCKKDFLSWFPTKKIQFCSNPCFQRYHYRNKSYHEVRKCKWCKKKFSVRKNEKTGSCSKKCAALLWRSNVINRP